MYAELSHNMAEVVALLSEKATRVELHIKCSREKGCTLDAHVYVERGKGAERSVVKYDLSVQRVFALEPEHVYRAASLWAAWHIANDTAELLRRRIRERKGWVSISTHDDVCLPELDVAQSLKLEEWLKWATHNDDAYRCAM